MAIKKVMVGDLNARNIPVHQTFVPGDELTDPLGLGSVGGANAPALYNWVYSTSTDRLAATGFSSSDIGKVAYQSSDKSLWILTAISPAPVWQPLGTGATDNRTQTMTGYYQGTASTGTNLFVANFTEALRLPINCIGSAITVAAATTCTLTLYKDTTSIGTVTFSNSTAAVFSVAAITEFSSGNLFKVTVTSGSITNPAMSFGFYALSVHNEAIVMPGTIQNMAGASTFTVPANCNQILVKVWGAGGGGYSTTAYGGAGAYVTATIPVTPGEVLTSTAGGGGGASVYTQNGYAASMHVTTCGGGGGYSGIKRNNDWLVLAGGGGGAGVFIGNSSAAIIATSCGGGGGDYSDLAVISARGTSSHPMYYSIGGDINKPGSPYVGSTIVPSTSLGGAGGYLSGGNGTISSVGASGGGGSNGGGSAGSCIYNYGAPSAPYSYFGGGGGGGGYFGGAGGTAYGAASGTPLIMGAGAGGSSYVHRSAINYTVIPGTGYRAPNYSDPDCAGAGYGGTSQTQGGGDGKVVVYYLTGSNPVPSPSGSAITLGTYTYTGSTQEIIPDGCNRIAIKAWGAGGGGAKTSDTGMTASGGSAAYAGGTSIPVNPGDILNIFVGGGGKYAPIPPTYSMAGGGGGGWSGVQNTHNNEIYVIAAGGGGASVAGATAPSGANGGAGGATIGLSGSGSFGGKGGTQNAGGDIITTGSGGTPAMPGTWLCGGNGHVGVNYSFIVDGGSNGGGNGCDVAGTTGGWYGGGGGGGGGYFGGGGGEVNYSNGTIGGGGGGSSYHVNYGGGTAMSGSNNPLQPGNYSARPVTHNTVGNGGVGLQDGQDGLVIITYLA